MYKVLIIDDDRSTRYMLKRFKKWESYGFVIADEACDGKEALQKLKSSHFDLIITDIKMPGMDGIEFLQELKSMKWQACVIFLSTHSDFEYAKQGIRLGVFDYMTKPLNGDLLSEALERAKTYLDEEYLKRTKIEAEKKQLTESAKLYYPKKREKTLAACLLSGSPQITEEIESTFVEITEMFEGDLYKIGILLNTMLVNLSEEIYAAFPWLQKLEGNTFTFDMTDAQSIAEMKQKFLVYINSSLEMIKKYELHHADSVIRRTCAYVIDHVEQDIKLEMIANEVHISKDYIGKLFKQKTGCNFNDFVTKVKMEHAKYLIRTGEFKNYEVSEKLGYSKPDYFSRLFKKYTGYTPTEFKKLYNNLV
ncbi:AraC family transcriptional regulator [Desulforamulus profundi]|uniref:Stage 0 sporulation protein A homolog n=1 Tax=Desulforamulus profundi TaxID=1383067 RepID=A0A2C6M3I1_9FIRM|nr:response regulator [Desulforamulus profundi]PHJ36677.1 AraC family transcriptional regulator [Desulforamulus profundi]